MNIKPEYEKSETTSKIIGAAMAVHKEFGPHYLEVAYQRALAIELNNLGIDFSRETPVPIYYKDQKIDTRRADFIIENVLVEVKVKSELDQRDYEQILSYLKSSGYKVGLLVNFGAASLEYHRKINTNGAI